MEIIVEELGKTYADGTRAIDGISFKLFPGEQLTLIGPNGCGKSTLMKCLIGLELPTAGSIRINELDLTALRGRPLRRLRARIGCVFQQMNLVPNLSVIQNVLWGAMGRLGYWRALNLTASASLRAQAMSALERVGLADLGGRRTSHLSGGQQQRVAIARMLMQDARVVIADEPVASLDPRAAAEVMDLLCEIVEERAMSLICILHQMDLVDRYARRVLGMRAGRIEFDLPADQCRGERIEALYRS
jgi:phosphonate transport system ATP-binding protein